jgi:hypothetical protein
MKINVEFLRNLDSKVACNNDKNVMHCVLKILNDIPRMCVMFPRDKVSNLMTYL